MMKWIKSPVKIGNIHTILIIGLIICFTGNIHVSFGFYLPNQQVNLEPTLNNINNTIYEENWVDYSYISFSTRKLFGSLQTCSDSGPFNYCGTLSGLGTFYNKNQTVENLFNKIKDKSYKKEYKTKLFDKSRYNIESGIQIDYEENDGYIQYLSRNITYNLKNPSRKEIAGAVYSWVKSNVDYEYPTYYESKHYASQTAKLKRGNCCDQARLVIALCRAAGIPRQATEYYHSECVELGCGKIVGHVWPVITSENGEKIICDTTCSGGSFGSPSWKNWGYVKQSFFLSF